MSRCPCCGNSTSAGEREAVGRVLGAFLTLQQVDQAADGLELRRRQRGWVEDLCPGCLTLSMASSV